MPKSSPPGRPSRREFIKTTSAMAAGTMIGGLAGAGSVHAAGSDTLRIGLVGCGGRGTGAAANALGADPNCKLVAMADAFADRLQSSLGTLKKQFGDKVAVDPEHCFIGLDAYQKVIASGVDVVLLTTPPHFRPQHLRACIEAGKHVFAEKPVAVDAPGVRSVLESAEAAKKKNLNLVVGLCWRYHPGVRATMKRVLDGAIGQIKALQETYLTGLLWKWPRKPKWTEMEFQLRNWMYFSWLSGDFNTEQHVHSLDKAAWAMHDEPPLRAWGLGGRQVRTDPQFGDVFDHHAVVYEYPDGVSLHSYCRQMAGCYNDVSDHFIGDKGRASILNFRIEGENPWHYRGPEANMYDVEHQELFAAIRAGKAINNGLHGARSTMMAILGRMVNYTGKTLTWDQAINSQQRLAPEIYALDAAPPVVPGKDGKYTIAMPGVTQFF